MKKFRFIPLMLIILALLLLLTACGEDEDGDTPSRENYPTKSLNVYNWGEYISNEDDEEYGLFDVNAGFEDYFNENLADEYGFYIKVNYSTYATNEDMYAKLTNSAVAYDIVIPSDYMIQKMIANDLLLEIDFSKLTNYGNISDDFKGMYYDPDDKYSVPYTYGMLGIIYNSEFVDEEDVADESWTLLWNEKYKGKILQFNNPRDAFGTAMYWHNLDVNSRNYADWEAALELLKEQKPLLQGYVNDEIFNKMKSVSAYVAPYYAGDFLTMAADNEDLMFYYPAEGTNYFVDAMCIPKTSRNPDVAHEYINYMISLEAATANALYIGYASPNKAVTESEYYQEMLAYNYDTDSLSAWDILYGKTKDEANENYSFNPAYEDYFKDDANGINIQTHVDSLWESLKTENSTELWVHITSFAIVAGVLTFAIRSQYIKKKRSKFYRDRDRELRRQREMQNKA